MQVVKISSLQNLVAGLDEHLAAGTRMHGSLSIGTAMYWCKLNIAVTGWCNQIHVHSHSVIVIRYDVLDDKKNALWQAVLVEGSGHVVWSGIVQGKMQAVIMTMLGSLRIWDLTPIPALGFQLPPMWKHVCRVSEFRVYESAM
jgi:hypothetical protein